MQILKGDITEEESIQSGFSKAQERFGLPSILIVNTAQESGTRKSPIWDLSLDDWEKSYLLNVRGSFLAIKHFLRSVRDYQQISGSEVAGPAIVIAETETSEGLATGKTGLHYGLLNSVRDEIVCLNSEGRINSVVSKHANTNAGENLATPADVARTMAFLASKRAAGHISGQCIQVEGGKVSSNTQNSKAIKPRDPVQFIPRALANPKRNKIRVAVSIDLDAVSGWLGTSTIDHLPYQKHNCTS